MDECLDERGSVGRRVRMEVRKEGNKKVSGSREGERKMNVCGLERKLRQMSERNIGMERKK